MRNHLKYMIPLALVAGCIPAHAQWYNDTAVTNAGGMISDWSNQAWNTVNGNYSTAGSTGAPSNYGVFEHYGQTGTGNSSALRNEGIYNAAVNGRDYFKGPNNTAGQQGIGGAAAPVFGALFLQNGAGQLFDITNTNGVEVAGSVSFANGITTTVRSTAATGALKLRDNATYTNTALGDAQYVNGYVTKTGDDAFTFPVGAQGGADLRTLQVTALATATDALSVAFWAGSAAAGLDPTVSGTQSLTTLNPAGAVGVDRLFSVSPLCFWDWIPLSGTGAVTITVSLPAFSGNGGYATAGEMRLVGWNTATQQWDNLSGSTGATGTAEGSSLSGTVTNMGAYSAIAVGSVLTVPLPVMITAFGGYIDNQCAAQLSWTTAQEQNVKDFVVQYSPDGKRHNDVGTVSCHNNAEGGSYTLYVPGVSDGDALFRLKITDKDGSIAYHSNELRLKSDCNKRGSIQVWPNPAGDHISVAGLGKHTTIRLTDISGRQLLMVSADAPLAQLDLKSFKAGLYVLHILVDNVEVTREKVIKL